MYFSTISEYDINETNDDTNDNENICIICWVPSEKYNKLIKMRALSSFSIFSKTCDCNSAIHSECLLKWINIDNSCPICHQLIIPNKIDNLLYKTQLQRLIYFTYEFSKCIKYIIAFSLLTNYILFIIKLIHQVEP